MEKGELLLFEESLERLRCHEAKGLPTLGGLFLIATHAEAHMTDQECQMIINKGCTRLINQLEGSQSLMNHWNRPNQHQLSKIG
jgi:hypothetical protein